MKQYPILTIVYSILGITNIVLAFLLPRNPPIDTLLNLVGMPIKMFWIDILISSLMLSLAYNTFRFKDHEGMRI